MTMRDICIDTEGEVGQEFRDKLNRDLALHAMPPRSQADLDRFWTDVEEAARDRQDSTEYVVFDSFYLR
jgi:hypothetical protein